MILQALKKASTKVFRYICSMCDYFHLFVRKYRLIFSPLNAFACEAKNIKKKEVRSWSEFIKVILIKDRFSLIPLGVGLGLGIFFF